MALAMKAGGTGDVAIIAIVVPSDQACKRFITF